MFAIAVCVVPVLANLSCVQILSDETNLFLEFCVYFKGVIFATRKGKMSWPTDPTWKVLLPAKQGFLRDTLRNNAELQDRLQEDSYLTKTALICP